MAEYNYHDKIGSLQKENNMLKEFIRVLKNYYKPLGEEELVFNLVLESKWEDLYSLVGLND